MMDDRIEAPRLLKKIQDLMHAHRPSVVARSECLLLSVAGVERSEAAPLLARGDVQDV